jgi:hypothetical protein
MLLSVGSLLTTSGLAIAATSPVVGTDGSERTHAQALLGGVFVVLGWAVLAWGIHQFGRDER